MQNNVKNNCFCVSSLKNWGSTALNLAVDFVYWIGRKIVWLLQCGKTAKNTHEIGSKPTPQAVQKLLEMERNLSKMQNQLCPSETDTSAVKVQLMLCYKGYRSEIKNLSMPRDTKTDSLFKLAGQHFGKATTRFLDSQFQDIKSDIHAWSESDTIQIMGE